MEGRPEAVAEPEPAQIQFRQEGTRPLLGDSMGMDGVKEGDGGQVRAAAPDSSPAHGGEDDGYFPLAAYLAAAAAMVVAAAALARRRRRHIPRAARGAPVGGR